MHVQFTREAYERVVRSFSVHLVGVELAFSRDDKVVHRAVISTFVLSVRDQWFLITAGHCIDDVNQNLRDGATVSAWLIDGLGAGAIDKHKVPFDWNGAQPTRLFEEDHLDYGVLWVDAMVRRQLEANRIVAITEKAWEYQMPKAEVYLLLGLPGDLVRANYPESVLTPVALQVFEADHVPPGIEDKPDRWYGYVDQGLPDIRGMSGGPILAIGRDEAGVQKYWIHAVQSKWWKESRGIAACPMRPIAAAMAVALEAMAAAA